MSNNKNQTEMKAQESKSKIVNFLVKNPNSDAKAISEATKIPRSEIFGIIASSKEFTTYQKSAKTVKLFSVVVMPSVEKAKEVKAKAEAKAAEVAEKSEGKNFGRDFSKYLFDGQELRKGKLAYAVIKKLVDGLTFKEAHAMFNDDLVRNYGAFTDAALARRINQQGKQRYFTEASMLIKLKCGTSIAVTNQWGSHNIGKIIEIARENGLKIVEPTMA